jgi:quercetin dioxygenase-like cupin family protein
MRKVGNFVLTGFASMTILLPVLGLTDPHSPDVKTGGISRKLVGHNDVPGTDMEMRTYLITYPPGAAAPPHHHPVVGLGYIVKGKAESKYQGHAAKIISENESFEDLAVIPHEVFKNLNADQSLVFVISYVAKKGAPVVETP